MSESALGPVIDLDEPDDRPPARGSYPFLAALMGASAVIHFAMVPVHAAESTLDAVGFALAAWVQAIVAVLCLTRPDKRVLQVGIVANLAIIGLWAWSRTVGLPVGGHAGVVSPIESIDAACTAFEAAFVVGAGIVLARPAPAPARHQASMASLLAAPAVLVLATILVVSPEAANHGSHDHAHGDGVAAGHVHDDTAAGAHVHDDGTVHDHSNDPARAALAADRCDRDLNPVSYYRDAELAGVDTVQGVSGGAHQHGSTGGEVTTTTAPPAGESEESKLARLSQETGELGAAQLVIELSGVSDAEYDSWLQSLNTQHDTAAPDDNGGHGGHMGPQPWEAIDDTATCERLRAEIDTAREIALAHPTAADAKADGWVMVTPYVPGIAAHYMKFAYVDGSFEVDKPEMILYDGNGDDANVIGLSYYIMKDGDDEPTDGFIGNNDHYHRHVGLCMKGALVIGDTTTTKAECEARGGRKQNGSAGWMSHAWVVPGCESPWGLFSAANPVLDGELGTNSGQGASCSGSSVVDRYDLSPAPADDPGVQETAAGP